MFHFVSKHRKLTDTERCLILATGFYEYTDPKKPTVKLKDQHFFTIKDRTGSG